MPEKPKKLRYHLLRTLIHPQVLSLAFAVLDARAPTTELPAVSLQA